MKNMLEILSASKVDKKAIGMNPNSIGCWFPALKECIPANKLKKSQENWIPELNKENYNAL